MVDIEKLSSNLGYSTTTKKYINDFFDGLSNGLRVNNSSKAFIDSISKNDEKDVHPLEEKKLRQHVLFDSVQTANKELGLIKTLDNSFDKLDDIIKKIEVKAVQASSDEATTEEKEKIQDEIAGLVQEFQDTRNDVTYSGTPLLYGNLTYTLKEGAEDISINIPDMSAYKSGFSSYKFNNFLPDNSGVDYGRVTLQLPTKGMGYFTLSTSMIGNQENEGLGRLADMINEAYDQTGIEASADVVFEYDGFGAPIEAGFVPEDFKINGVTIDEVAFYDYDSSGALVDAINKVTEDTGVTASVKDGVLNLVSDGRAIKIEKAGTPSSGGGTQIVPVAYTTHFETDTSIATIDNINHTLEGDIPFLPLLSLSNGMSKKIIDAANVDELITTFGTKFKLTKGLLNQLDSDDANYLQTYYSGGMPLPQGQMKKIFDTNYDILSVPTEDVEYLKEGFTLNMTNWNTSFVERIFDKISFYDENDNVIASFRAGSGNQTVNTSIGKLTFEEDGFNSGGNASIKIEDITGAFDVKVRHVIGTLGFDATWDTFEEQTIPGGPGTPEEIVGTIGNLLLKKQGSSVIIDTKGENLHLIGLDDASNPTTYINSGLVNLDFTSNDLKVGVKPNILEESMDIIQGAIKQIEETRTQMKSLGAMVREATADVLMNEVNNQKFDTKEEVEFLSQHDILSKDQNYKVAHLISSYESVMNILKFDSTFEENGHLDMYNTNSSMSDVEQDWIVSHVYGNEDNNSYQNTDTSTISNPSQQNSSNTNLTNL
jgi:flagellin-like hook-associated protein FlgL